MFIYLNPMCLTVTQKLRNRVSLTILADFIAEKKIYIENLLILFICGFNGSYTQFECDKHRHHRKKRKIYLY